MNKKTMALVFLLIILLGTTLRFSFIQSEDLWLDEGFTLITAEQPTFSKVTESVFFFETAPPLYFYILNIWIKLLGNSTLATRSLSAIFGILSLPLIFLIARKISDEKTAILTTLLSSISMMLIWTSQEIRPYSFLVFLTLLSTLALTNLYQKNKPHYYLLYFLSLILLLYTSYFSVFVMFFHFMAITFTKKYKFLFKLFLTQLFAFLFLIPWLLKAIPRSNLSSGVVYELLLYHAGLPKWIAQFGQFALVSPLIFLSLALVIIFIINLKYKIKITKKHYTILSLLILLVLFNYIILITNLNLPLVRQYFTWSRYFIFLIPVAHYIAAKTALNINNTLRILILILAILTSALALNAFYSTTLREEWTPAMQFIEQTRDSNNGIIFIDEGGANMYLIDKYYSGPMKPVELAWKDKELSMNEISEKLENKEFAWLILSRNWKRKNHYLNLFNDNFNQILKEEFHGIKLYLFETP
jgi:mannosyltransferase